MFESAVLFPISDPDEWAENYGLELETVPCIGCGTELILSRPFATKDGVRGLTTFKCPNCPETRTPFIFTYK